MRPHRAHPRRLFRWGWLAEPSDFWRDSAARSNSTDGLAMRPHHRGLAHRFPPPSFLWMTLGWLKRAGFAGLKKFSKNISQVFRSFVEVSIIGCLASDK